MIEKESDIWQKFLKIKFKNWIRRIEAKSISEGIPDIILIQKDNDVLFVENKIIDKFIKKNNNNYINPKIRSSQLRWMLQYPKDACFLIYIKEEKKFSIVDKKDTCDLKKGLYCIFDKNILNEEQVINNLLNYTKNKNVFIRRS